MAALFAYSAAPRAILVICTGRIGDVLLSTPAVRSLKMRWPDAQIDVLVFDGTAEVLENNPDIRRIVRVAPHATLSRRCTDALRIWRRYDLACSLRTSGLACMLCWVAGHKRIGVVASTRKRRLKTLLLHRFVVDADHDRHVLETSASLMALLDIAPCFEVATPRLAAQAASRERLQRLLTGADGKRYAVVHMYPRYAYKMWHRQGWIALLQFLRARGYGVVLTGGPAQAEVRYAEDISGCVGGDVVNLVGKLSLAASAEVIRRAVLFVGPDTSASHIAAATGTPTLVLFGPSNPVRWGPWPKGWRGVSPWRCRGSARRGNVYLLQGVGACVPCQKEGCNAHIHSSSECLEALAPDRVIDAAAALLDIHALAVES